MIKRAKLIGIIAALLLTSFSQIEDEKEIGSGMVKAKVMGEINLDYIAECELSTARLNDWILIKAASVYDLEEIKFGLNIILIIKDKKIKASRFNVLNVERACKERGNYAVCLFTIEDSDNLKVDFEGIKGQVNVEVVDEDISLITFEILVRNKETGKVLKIKNGLVIFTENKGAQG